MLMPHNFNDWQSQYKKSCLHVFTKFAKNIGRIRRLGYIWTADWEDL
jgi:hypothetical protein